MSRRIPALLVLAGLIIGAIALGLFDPPVAHFAALVPKDAKFVVVSRSLNSLRAAYEGEYADRSSDPSVARIGTPVNVPDLNGFDYDRPIGMYVRDTGSPVYLVPFTDLGALEDAHGTARENINAKAPVRVARRYVSIADDDAVANVAKDDKWVLEASNFPLALVAAPSDASEFRGMLVTFFGQDAMPRVRNAVPLSAMCGTIPDAFATPFAEEFPKFRLALAVRKRRVPAVVFDFRAPVKAGGIVEAAADAGVDPAGLLAEFPAAGDMTTVVGLAAASSDWKARGLPFDPGPAAGAFAVVTMKYRAGRNNIVFAVQPKDPARLKDMRVAPENANEGVIDGNPMRSWALTEPPAAFANMLADAGNKAAPLHACEAIVNGRWILTMGSHGEELMRAMIRRATGATTMTLRNLAGEKTIGPEGKGSGKVVPMREHENFFAPGRVAVGFMLGEAQKAVAHPFPYIPMASIGQPDAVTFTVEVQGGWVKGDLRCFVADGK